MDVIVLEQTQDAPTPLASRLEAAGCRVTRVTSLSALDSELSRRGGDVIVVDLPSPCSRLIEQVGRVGRRHERPVAVFVDATDALSIRLAVRAGVSSYVVRGAQTDRLRDALEVARARFAEERTVRAELASARSSLAERKLIERAKGVLMKRDGLDEEAAYAALRRGAMRSNRRIAEVARMLLSEEST